MNAMLLEANLAPAIIREGQRRLIILIFMKAQTKGDHSQLKNFFVTPPWMDSQF